MRFELTEYQSVRKSFKLLLFGLYHVQYAPISALSYCHPNHDVEDIWMLHLADFPSRWKRIEWLLYQMIDGERTEMKWH